MGRGKKYFIDYGDYTQCLLCNYRLRNNKKGMKLHFKYSHPTEVYVNGEKDIVRCRMCKKENCLLH